MGVMHLQQMLCDAMEVDCAALPVAMQLCGPFSDMEAQLFGCGFWDKLFVDQRVDIARKLVKLRDRFSTRLKEMLLEGEIVVFAHSSTGEVVKLRNTDVIDFDDLVLDRHTDFCSVFMNMPTT